MHLASSAQQEPEAVSTTSMVLTFLPLVLLVGFFFFFVRFVRRTNARAKEAMQLSRDMVAELRAIRAALEQPGAPRAVEAKPIERENTLSGQTIPTR
jgi:hypothetical protein